MKRDEGQKIRCLSQQEIIYEAENKILKKKLQELKEIQVKYDQILNSRKYKLLSALSQTQGTPSSELGENEENLTWVVNGNEKIFPLLDSFFQYEKGFAGKMIVAIDEEEKELQEALKDYFSDKKREYKFHYAGKEKNRYDLLNEISEVVETEWMFYIDSDCLFTKQCLESLHQALKETGCHFINLPVRDAKTEWVFNNQLSEEYLTIGRNVKILNPKITRFTKCIEKFSGVLNMDALLMKKETFEKFGKFQPEYRGLEALEMAYRIRKNEYAIGNCTDVFLRSSKAETEPEEVDEEIVGRFQEEYGFGITNDVTELDEYVKRENRLRVAVIADAENWSYHNIAKQIQSCLKDEMDVDIFFYEYTPNAIQIILGLRNYDIIHFMWRGSVYILSEQEAGPYLAQVGMTYEEFRKDYLDKICLTTSVYDHLLLQNEKDLNMTRFILETCDEYTVSSEKLSRIYQEKFEKSPLKSVTDGVDLDKFYPQNLERFQDREDKNLVIGWVGNSKFWGMKDKDLKGVNTILKPAVAELQQEGAAVERYFADRQERMIPHDKMCEYYSKVDVLICTSIVEGTPNPVLEAMACGVPVISTDVGIVPEALGEFQKQFILRERTVDCLKDAIRKFLEHPEYLEKCSRENLESIKLWSWYYKTQDFKEFFEEAYEKHRRGL